MHKTIVDSFEQFFEIIPAITDEQKMEVYKLRYQVYCLEIHGLEPSEYPNGMESDEFDEHSAHYLIRHRVSDEYVATTRLILPNKDDSNQLFQLERYCQINELLTEGINRQNIGEASRFCVSKEFKRRKNQTQFTSITGGLIENCKFDSDERRVFPSLTLGLFTCLIRASYENNIDYWYAILELPLIRFFSSLGIHFVKIGPYVDIHGERWPCMIKVSDLLYGVARKNIEIWEMFTNKGQFWSD